MDGIGSRLRSERKRLELSQHEMGAVGGIEANAQGLYERGKRFPNAGYLSLIARVGVDILFVITGTRKVKAIDTMTDGDTKLLSELDGLPDEVQQDIKRLISTLFHSDDALRRS